MNKRALEEIEKAGLQASKNKSIAVAREARKKHEPLHEQSTNRSTLRCNETCYEPFNERAT